METAMESDNNGPQTFQYRCEDEGETSTTVCPNPKCLTPLARGRYTISRVPFDESEMLTKLSKHTSCSNCGKSNLTINLKFASPEEAFAHLESVRHDIERKGVHTVIENGVSTRSIN